MSSSSAPPVFNIKSLLKKVYMHIDYQITCSDGKLLELQKSTLIDFVSTIPKFVSLVVPGEQNMEFLKILSKETRTIIIALLQILKDLFDNGLCLKSLDANDINVLLDNHCTPKLKETVIFVQSNEKLIDLNMLQLGQFLKDTIFNGCVLPLVVSDFLNLFMVNGSANRELIFVHPVIVDLDDQNDYFCHVHDFFLKIIKKIPKSPSDYDDILKELIFLGNWEPGVRANLHLNACYEGRDFGRKKKKGKGPMATTGGSGQIVGALHFGQSGGIIGAGHGALKSVGAGKGALKITQPSNNGDSGQPNNKGGSGQSVGSRNRRVPTMPVRERIPRVQPAALLQQAPDEAKITQATASTCIPAQTTPNGAGKGALKIPQPSNNGDSGQSNDKGGSGQSVGSRNRRVPTMPVRERIPRVQPAKLLQQAPDEAKITQATASTCIPAQATPNGAGKGALKITHPSNTGQPNDKGGSEQSVGSRNRRVPTMPVSERIPRVQPATLLQQAPDEAKITQATASTCIPAQATPNGPAAASRASSGKKNYNLSLKQWVPKVQPAKVLEQAPDDAKLTQATASTRIPAQASPDGPAASSSASSAKKTYNLPRSKPEKEVLTYYRNSAQHGLDYATKDGRLLFSPRGLAIMLLFHFPMLLSSALKAIHKRGYLSNMENLPRLLH